MALKGLLRVALLALFVVAVQGTWVLAGTVGTIQGTVTDDSGHPVADAAVAVIAPSQSGHTTTDSKGFFSVLNLSPDTYQVTASKDGYDPTTIYGITVTADQVTTADVTLHVTAKVIGHVTATAPTSVVNKSVTGDLYAVSAQTVNQYQGSSGGAESLYSQNGIVGSLPGVVRTVGSGAGYYGQGTLSIRGGAYDQVGFELDGIPLNRGFDFYNGTSFLTNGISSLEVYTGGAPADAGRAMSGYINQVIQRGSYPGGADLTMINGTPSFNHSLQTDVFGATADGHFSYYMSTLALNFSNGFNNQSNDNNLTYNIPANDAGCNDFNALNSPVTINCAQPNSLSAPFDQGSYLNNAYADERDTVANLHWTFTHGAGLNDDLQALYVVGYTLTPQYDQYSGAGTDPALNCIEFACELGPQNQILYPTGYQYTGGLNAPYEGLLPNGTPGLLNTPLTWPSSNGAALGDIPSNYYDNQTTQYSIEKLGYTRSLSPTSFVRVFGYQMYSFWTLNQATEGIVGGTFYQLHDNATGVTMNYQNQLNSQNLLKFDVDWSKDLTLRYNYGNWLGQETGGANVVNNFVTYADCYTNPDLENPFVFSNLAPCSANGQEVAQIHGPYGYWSSTTPEFSDAALDDVFKPSNKLQLDLGVRDDSFVFALMPLQITGPNGLAEQAQNLDGNCLHGYAYASTDPCFGYDNSIGGIDAAGAANWQNVSGNLTFNDFSPRFGATFTPDNNDVIRASVGRYVQPPDSAFEEYRSAPFWGPGNTVDVLNRYYDGLGFLAVHDVQPEDSTNYDLSFEHSFDNGLSAKLTPFYRDTRGQILNLPVNPAQPSFVTGYNFGDAHISGVEFLATKGRTGQDGLSGTLSATYTDAKIRFEKAADGLSFIDTLNGVMPNGQCPTSFPNGYNGICGYNALHGTSYPLLDPNAYYYPSYTQSPLTTSASYTVPWVATLTLDERTHGFDIEPIFNYQSGYPYGDPGLFPDATGVDGTFASVGPDPYTNAFDAPGSLQGPSWLTMNLTLSHDLGHDTKASILATNLFSSIHNHGYPWELPTSDGAVNYGDNYFYRLVPLGTAFDPGALQSTHYLGTNYYPYAPQYLLDAREYVFSISTKI